MFKFLKDKLKSTISTITDKFNAAAKEETAEEEVKVVQKQEQPAILSTVQSKQPELKTTPLQESSETIKETISSPEPTKTIIMPEIPAKSEIKPEITQQQKTQQQFKKQQPEQVKEKKKPRQDEPKVVPKKNTDYRFEEKQFSVSSQPNVINEIKEDEVKPQEIERPSIEVESKDIERTFIEPEDKAFEEDSAEQKPEELQELKESKKAIEEEESNGFFPKLKSKIYKKKEELQEPGQVQKD